MHEWYLMENTIIEALTSIGQTLGIPAVVLSTWLIFSLRSLNERVKKLENEQGTRLSKIETDIAFIRGRLEGKV